MQDLLVSHDGKLLYSDHQETTSPSQCIVHCTSVAVDGTHGSLSLSPFPTLAS